MKLSTILTLSGVLLVAASAAINAAPDAEVLALGKKIHDLGTDKGGACVACHGPDGKGIRAGDLITAPNLYESEMLKQDNPAALALVLLKGIKKENADYLQQMLALQESFTDEEIAAVMTYVRHTYADKTGTIKTGNAKNFRKQFSKVPALVKRGDVDGKVIQARGAKAILSDLHWTEYKGSWDKLPDFGALTPVAEGSSKLIDIGVTKAGDNFGLVFEGTLTLPADGPYEFTTASDDGSDLWIDGKRVVDNDGVHGVVSRSGKATLKAGEHKLVVRMFEKAGGQDIMASIKGKSLGGEIALSKKRVQRGGGGVPKPRIIVSPENAGEAVMYRNFIDGSNPRGIAVGYPGSSATPPLNICWDADTLELAMLWRGAFMDAGRHWTGRGQGAQAPAGEDVRKMHGGLPLMVLDTPDQAWPEGAHKVEYMSARDSADRKDKRTAIVKHPDYKFGGYRLDTRRFPTFNYSYQDLKVSDNYLPSEAGSMTRTLSFKGTAKDNTMFRLAKNATATDKGVQIDGMDIHVEGAAVKMRGPSGKQEALVPVTGSTILTLTYAWDTPYVAPKALEDEDAEDN